MNDNTPTESMIETPERLAEKLRRINYREPILPVPQRCRVDGCVNITHAITCQDCEIELEAIAQREEDRKASFWPALITVIIMLALIFAGCWQVGRLLRGAV